MVEPKQLYGVYRNGILATFPAGSCVDTTTPPRTRMAMPLAAYVDTRLDTSWTPSPARPHGSDGGPR
jgi:hypothetical protein